MLEDQIIFGMHYNDIIMCRSYYVCIMSIVGESYFLKIMHYNIALLPKKVTNYIN